jgi:hypothetical protein
MLLLHHAAADRHNDVRSVLFHLFQWPSVPKNRLSAFSLTLQVLMIATSASFLILFSEYPSSSQHACQSFRVVFVHLAAEGLDMKVLFRQFSFLQSRI